MRKSLTLVIFIVLFVFTFTILAFGGSSQVQTTPNPENFITYKSPDGLYEVVVPKDLPVIRKHKDGIVYGSPESGMIVAAGIRLFREKDDEKVDLNYIEEKLKEAQIDIEKSKGGKVVEGPKRYKDGMLMVVETENAPFPPKEKIEEGKEKPVYYIIMYVKSKNDKSLAILTYIPKDKYPKFKKDLDYMMDNLR